MQTRANRRSNGTRPAAAGMDVNPSEPGGVSPKRFRTIALVALGAQVLIIITGSIVRLTESGLGCSDWPTCEEDTVVPALDVHAWIEYVNRVVITGVVSLAVLAAVVGAWKRKPSRTDLTRLSWGLVAGVIGQILLGRVVVLSDLNPWLVIGHFILSMVLVWNAVFLLHRAGIPDDEYHATSMRTYRPQAWVMSVLAAVVVFSGTLVTGSGPHGGSHLDEPIERLPFDIPSIARTHGITVVMLLSAVVFTLYWLMRNGGSQGDVSRCQVVLGVLLAQGALGYVQYFSGVPAVLVGFHIAGAIAVWIAVLWFHFNSSPPAISVPKPALDKLDKLAALSTAQPAHMSQHSNGSGSCP